MDKGLLSVAQADAHLCIASKVLKWQFVDIDGSNFCGEQVGQLRENLVCKVLFDVEAVGKVSDILLGCDVSSSASRVEYRYLGKEFWRC